MKLLFLLPLLALLQPDRTPRPDRPEPFTPRERAPRQEDGPWNRKIHIATSDDGLAFAEGGEPVLLRACAADIIELARDLPKGSGDGASKGHLCIYALDGRDRAASGIIRLTSTDGGKTWSQPRTITFRGGDSATNPMDPAIVQLEDGRLRMYITGMKPRNPGPLKPKDVPPGLPPPAQPPSIPGVPSLPKGPGLPGKIDPVIPPAASGGSHAVLSAISDDGLTFTLEPGVRFEGGAVTDPDIVRTGDQWLMFLSRGDETLLTRSTDGLIFERDHAVTLRGGSPGASVLSDGRVRIYVSTTDGITSTVLDPKNNALILDSGQRFKGPCADPAVCPRAAGGVIAVIERFIADPDRGPARYDPAR